MINHYDHTNITFVAVTKVKLNITGDLLCKKMLATASVIGDDCIKNYKNITKNTLRD